MTQNCFNLLSSFLQGGIYYFQIVDYYAAALSLMYIAFFECVAVLWVYGVRRLAGNIKDMSGEYPSQFFTLCWRVVSPMLIFVSTDNHFSALYRGNL